MANWDRMIALVDMAAFFASICQLDAPELRGRPIGVTNGMRGTTIITSSYEARAYGIKTGMRVREARALCPEFIQVPSRPARFAAVSRRIMSALDAVTPIRETFSVDECFLDLSAVQRLHQKTPHELGRWIQQIVFEASGLLCSVGISGDKTVAKYASKLDKPAGLTVIEPWRAAERLASVPVTELCGISDGIGRFLAQRGVHVCGDMKTIPISALAARFGNPGRRLWLMAQARDPEPVHTGVAPAKTIGHGKVIPPNTRDRAMLEAYFMHMAEKVGGRLRKHGLVAQRYAFALTTDLGVVGTKSRAVAPTADGAVIYGLARAFLDHAWDGQGAFQVQINALDPRAANVQHDLFLPADDSNARLNQAIDRINQRFGAFAVCRAPLLGRSENPDVISPAWRPDSTRDSIDS